MSTVVAGAAVGTLVGFVVVEEHIDWKRAEVVDLMSVAGKLVKGPIARG